MNSSGSMDLVRKVGAEVSQTRRPVLIELTANHVSQVGTVSIHYFVDTSALGYTDQVADADIEYKGTTWLLVESHNGWTPELEDGSTKEIPIGIASYFSHVIHVLDRLRSNTSMFAGDHARLLAAFFDSVIPEYENMGARVTVEIDKKTLYSTPKPVGEIR